MYGFIWIHIYSYGFITLGSIADSCGFWAPDEKKIPGSGNRDWNPQSPSNPWNHEQIIGHEGPPVQPPPPNNAPPGPPPFALRLLGWVYRVAGVGVWWL
jgi:hypothetical protein